jgi:hypothetical protein
MMTHSQKNLHKSTLRFVQDKRAAQNKTPYKHIDPTCKLNKVIYSSNQTKIAAVPIKKISVVPLAEDSLNPLKQLTQDYIYDNFYPPRHKKPVRLQANSTSKLKPLTEPPQWIL